MGKPELLKPQTHLLDLDAVDKRNIATSTTPDTSTTSPTADPCAGKSDADCGGLQECEWNGASCEMKAVCVCPNGTAAGDCDQPQVQEKCSACNTDYNLTDDSTKCVQECAEDPEGDIEIVELCKCETADCGARQYCYTKDGDSDKGCYDVKKSAGDSGGRNLQANECPFDDEGDCDSLGNKHGCSWVDSKCQKCSALDVGTGTDGFCSAAENCLWNTKFGRCQLDCKALDTSKDCHHVHGCVWEDNKCSNCADYTETAVCKAHSDYCELVDEKCEARCSNFRKENQCLDFGCNWNGKKCGHLDEEDCTGNDDELACKEAACGWDTECKACADFGKDDCPAGCKVGCSVLPNDDDSCPKEEVCKPDCGEIDSKHFCRKKKGCHLNGETCTNDTAHTDTSCKKIDRKDDCGYGCKWREEDDAEKPCVIDCSTIGSSGECESQNRCDWSSSDDVCKEDLDFKNNGLPDPDINREQSAKTFDNATKQTTKEVADMTEKKVDQIESNVVHTNEELKKMYVHTVKEIDNAAVETLERAAHNLDTKMKKEVSIANNSVEDRRNLQVACREKGTEADCTNLNACEWHSGICMEKKCSTEKSDVDCKKNDHCDWIKDRCVPMPCNTLKTVGECKHAHCRWEGNPAQCIEISLEEMKEKWTKAHKELNTHLGVVVNSDITTAEHIVSEGTKHVVHELTTSMTELNNTVNNHIEKTKERLKGMEVKAQGALEELHCEGKKNEEDCEKNELCDWDTDKGECAAVSASSEDASPPPSARRRDLNPVESEGKGEDLEVSAKNDVLEASNTDALETSKGENLEASSTDEALEASTQDRN